MEKELLSIVETVTKHRNILLGFRVHIHSDHANLKFENFSSERVRRWRLLLEEFDYSFHYTPGSTNIIADILSRYPTINLTTSSIQQMATVEINPSTFPLDFSTIANHQTSDSALQVSARSSSSFSSVSLSATSSLIFYNDKIVIPTSLVPHIISWYHNNLLHPGIQRTCKTIQSHFHIKNLSEKVAKFIAACPICIKSKKQCHQRNSESYLRISLNTSHGK